MSEESQDKDDTMVIDVNEDEANSATTSSTPQQRPHMSDSSSESRDTGESPLVHLDAHPVFRYMYSPESLGPGNVLNAGAASSLLSKGEKHTFSNTDNPNTNRKTEADMKILTSYLTSIGENRAPEDIPPAVLDKYLSTFFMAVKKYDGTEYEPCSLRAMLASIERYLRTKNYQVSLTRDVAFSGMRSHLKLKQLKLKGAKVDAVMCKQERLEKLYVSQKLGPYSPESVLFSLCFAICTYLKTKKLSEHKRLMWGDVVLCKDGAGEEYLTFSNQFLTKASIITRYNFKHSKLKIPAEPGNLERDSVGIYKLYCEKRPAAYNHPTAPFYLGIAVPVNSNLLSSWYRPSGLGVNKLNEFVRWSRELMGTSTSNRPVTAPSSSNREENSAFSLDGRQPADRSSLTQSSMQHPPLHADSGENSELMENGASDYQSHHPEEVHIIDSEEEEEESFDDTSQVSAAYVEDFSSNSGISADTSPIMYVQPCSPDYVPPQPAMEPPQPVFCAEDGHIGGGRFISVETAKQHLSTIIQHLDLSDLVTFDQWLKTMKISRDPTSGQIYCRDNAQSPDQGLQVSAIHLTNNNNNTNSNNSGSYGSSLGNGLGSASGASITLNISLSPQSLVGEGPVTVTALSRGSGPSTPNLGGFPTTLAQPAPPPPPPPAHQNPQPPREAGVEAVEVSDRRLKRKPAFPIHLYAANRRSDGKSSQGSSKLGGYKMVGWTRPVETKAPTVSPSSSALSPPPASSSSSSTTPQWHIPSYYTPPSSAGSGASKHDDAGLPVKHEKM